MSKVEDVARAIARSNCNPLLMSEIQIGLYEDKRWYDYRGTAKAAIEAMRVPTEEMTSDGIDVLDGGWNGRTNTPAANASIECWKAMIDAALKED